VTGAAPPQTVAATVRAMRRAGAAGEPVPAAEVAAWSQTFMAQLYGLQKPARYECRARVGAGTWVEATGSDVINARRLRLEVRALYLHPKVEKPLKAHRFLGGRCRDCGELDVCAGPDCEVPAPTPDSRAALPFDPAWFREPLQALHRIATTKVVNTTDGMKWKSETTFLLERLDQYDKETLA
jgi:hypothetical protein